VLADEAGFVHVFWGDEVSGDGSSGDDGAQYVAYTRWNGYEWTYPNEILTGQGERVAEFPAATLDSEQRIHLVWTGQWDYYYSNALAGCAQTPRCWSEPVLIAGDSARSPWSSAIAATETTVHVVYATRGRNGRIFHVASHDDGLTWTAATMVSDALAPDEETLSNVRLVADGRGVLHVVWQANDDEAFGLTVYYSRSVDGGVTWERPLTIDRKSEGDRWASYPYLAATSDSLILTYVFGPHIGRLERRSTDGGQSWSAGRRILSEMEGVNGYTIPLEDANGGKHMAINMRTRKDQRVGIYWADETPDGWTSPMQADVTSQAAHAAHFMDAAMDLGNEVHIVYCDNSLDELWHVSGVLEGVPRREPRQALSTWSESRTMPETTPSADEAAQAEPTAAPGLSSNGPPESGEMALGTAIVISGMSSLLVIALGCGLSRKRRP